MEPELSVSTGMLAAMTEIPAENYSPAWAADTRAALPRTGDEREILTAFLDWHRKTFELKCSGVPPVRLSEPGSTGLLRVIGWE